MRQKAAILMAVLLILSGILLTACSSGNKDLSDSRYVGTWRLTTMTLKEESEGFSEDYMLVLNGDGTGQFGDASEISSITWELTKSGFKTKGDTKLTFTDSGDNIKTSFFGVDLIFEKQP